MKRKGFTLIELLAVIVILAVIALITTTIITKVVENSRKNAAKNSALNYLDAVEKYVMYHDVDNEKYPEEIESSSLYQISNKEYIVPDGKTAVENKNLNDILGNTVKGEKPDKGIVEFDEKRKIVNVLMTIEGYNVTCTNSTSCAVEGKDTDPIPVLTIGNITSTNDTITIPYTVEIEKGEVTVECVYGTDIKYGQIGVINEENNTCTLSNLTKGTTYYFKLTPKSDKNKKGSSQTSSKTTLNYISSTEFKVGDYVYMIPEYVGSYTPSTNNSDDSYTGCPTSGLCGGCGGQDCLQSCSNGGTVTPSELRRWIIIKNDGTNIEMVSESISSTEITFAGSSGFENYINSLNKLSEQYENSQYTNGSRAFGYNSQVLRCSSYSASDCIDNTGHYVDTGGETPNDAGLVYAAMKIARGTNIEPLLAYKVDTNTYAPSPSSGQYWVASRTTGQGSYGLYYRGKTINTNGYLDVGTPYYTSTSCNYYPHRSIRPILKLKPDVKADTSGDGSSEHPWVLIEQ